MKMWGMRRRYEWCKSLFQCNASLFIRIKKRISSTCTTYSLQLLHILPPLVRCTKCMGAKYFVLRFLLFTFFCSSCADCRQLSCRCIKRNTSYLLKRNRAMIYILRKSEQKSIMHCSDRKICFVFNWNMILRALFKKLYVWRFSGALTRCTLTYAGEKV